MDLLDLRRSIDKTDTKIIDLFIKRMEISKQIAEYKIKNNKSVYDPQREKEKLECIADGVPDNMKEYIISLYSHIFKLSRDCQTQMIEEYNTKRND